MSWSDAPVTENETSSHKTRPLSGFLYAVICLVLFALLFRSAYAVMWQWWQGEDYNYCFFVPLVVLYLLWEKRHALGSVAAVPSWAGTVPLAAGIALYFLGELGGEFYCIYLGSWFVLVGCAWVYAGWRKLRSVTFPLLFLLAMFPLPNLVNFNLSLRLKLLSSKLGVLLMQWYGLSAYREGNVIDLGFARLQVVDACSGLRYFFPLIVLGILLAYYFRARFWKKIVLVLSAIPVSVVTNGLRIASVGILYQYWGPRVAEGFFHDFSGWFIFMFSLALLLSEMWVLRKIAPEPVLAENAPQTGVRDEHRERPTADAAVSPGVPFAPAKFGVAALLMVAAIVLTHIVDFREKVPSSRPFAQFPLRIANWQGVRTSMEQAYLDELKFDDYAMIDYKDPKGKMVSFYTAYFGSQTKGGSIHSPSTCLPGGGWVFEESGNATFPLGNAGDTMRVSRAYMQKDGVRELTYYWFPQRGRVLTNLYQLKLHTFWNAITSRRTDGALVRVITPVYGTEQLADAEARLQGFTRELSPVLAEFIPH